MPIIADGEAGFGGPLNVFELTKKYGVTLGDENETEAGEDERC